MDDRDEVGRDAKLLELLHIAACSVPARTAERAVVVHVSRLR